MGLLWIQTNANEWCGEFLPREERDAAVENIKGAS